MRSTWGWVILVELFSCLFVSTHFKLQRLLDGFPFGLNNGKYDGISRATICTDSVIAQYAILLGAQPQYGTTRALIEKMGSKFYRDGIPYFECIFQ